MYKFYVSFEEPLFKGGETLLGTKRKANRLIREKYFSFFNREARIVDVEGREVSVRYGNEKWQDE